MTTSEEYLSVVIIKSTFVAICMVLAIIGNSSVIIAVIRDKKMQTIPNFFVCGLAVTDLIYAVIGQSALIATTIPKRWVLGDFLCKSTAVIITTVLTASIWMLTAISINRYIAIKKPFQLNRIFTKKRALLIATGIWFFAIILALPPVIGLGSVNSGYNFCVPDARDNLIYPSVLMLTNYLVPFVSLIYCYVSIYRALKKQNIQKREMGIITPNSGSCQDLTIGGYSPRMLAKHIENRFKRDSKDEVILNNFNKLKSTRISSTSTEFVSFSNPVSPNSFLEVPNFNYARPNSGTITPNTMMAVEKHRLISKEKRVTLMLAVVVLAFFICFTPFVFGSILFAFELQPTDFGIVTFGIVVFGINGVVNPIIYGVMNKNFKQAYKEMYKCCLPKTKN